MKRSFWSLPRAAFAAMAMLAGIAEPAAAATIKSEKLQHSDQQFISIVGDIADGDLAKFRRLAVAHDDAVVFLASRGGLTAEALEIGKIIRIKGYDTFVGADSPCASACALIWLAGQTRYLDKGARVGFHATYVEHDGRKAESGVGNAVVGNYLTQLNLSQRAIMFATEAGPDNLNWLTLDNAASVGIAASPLSGRENADSADDGDRDIRLFRHVGKWTVAIDRTMGGGCFVLADYRDKMFRIGVDARAKLAGYMLLLGEGWGSIKEGEKYPVEVTFGTAAPWKATARGVQLGEAKGLMITFETGAIFENMSRAQELRVRYRDAEVADLRLEGSSDAIDAMVECQSAQKAARDPFAR